MNLSDEDLRDIAQGAPFNLLDSAGGWLLLLASLTFVIVKGAHYLGR